MNKFNKLLFSALSLLALTVMTSCEGGGISIEAAVANQRVMDAMEQMTTTAIESFEIDVEADVGYTAKAYDVDDVVLYERNLEAAGEVHIKANDIFGEDAVGSVVANASVLAVENEETLLDVDAGGKSLALAQECEVLEHHIAGGAGRERAAAEAAERAVENPRAGIEGGRRIRNAHAAGIVQVNADRLGSG